MSGVNPVNFEGIDLFIPGAYSKRKTKGTNVGGASLSSLVLIGECKGGIPFNATSDYPNPEDRVNWVSSTQELNDLIRDGAAYYGGLFALTPSNQEGVNPPSKVGIVRINKATKSTRVVVDTEAASLLDFSTVDYGLHTIQTKMKIMAGTTEGKRIIIKKEDLTIDRDNLINKMFSMSFVGDSAACIISLDPGTQELVTLTGSNGAGAALITTADTTGMKIGMLLYAGGTADITGPVAGVVTAIVANTSVTINQNLTNLNSSKTYKFKSNVLTTSCTDPTENIAIDLATYDTVGNLVAYIDTLTDYSATLTADGTTLVSTLDKILAADAIDLKTAKSICATLQAIIDWVNYYSVLLEVELHTGAVRRLPAVDADYVFLTGGAEGDAPVQQDYQDALDQICQAVDITLLGAMTGNLAIQAAISAHCTYMSGIEGKNERQACFGSALGDVQATIIANSQAINNSLGGYFGSQIKRYDKNGILTSWAGFYGACEILGMAAGNDIKFSPTNKMLNCIGIDNKYTPTQKNAYIKAGVMVAEKSSQGGIRVVRAVTTYQGTDLLLNEWQGVRTMLMITKDHRAYIETLIGESGDETVQETVQNKAISRLDYYETEKKWLINDPAYGNAYRNVKITFDADKVKVTYTATIVLVINFILINHNFTVIGAKE